MRKRRLAREAIANAPPRRNKFGAEKVKLDGYTFDSKHEAKVYEDLKVLLMAGDIRELQVHPFWYFKHPVTNQFLVIRSAGYPNGRKVKYSADFRFVDGAGVQVWDVKGMDTGESRLRRSLMELFHGIRVTVLKRAEMKIVSLSKPR